MPIRRTGAPKSCGVPYEYIKITNLKMEQKTKYRDQLQLIYLNLGILKNFHSCTTGYHNDMILQRLEPQKLLVSLIDLLILAVPYNDCILAFLITNLDDTDSNGFSPLIFEVISSAVASGFRWKSF